jgi:hypothetical protein
MLQADFVIGQSTNPNVYWDTQDPEGMVFPNDRGTETVTYVYQPAGYVPEPQAYVMLGTACLALLAVRHYLGRIIVPSETSRKNFNNFPGGCSLQDRGLR